MSKEKLLEAIKRIKAISWEYNYDRLNSHAYLLREYFRRSALWATSLGVSNKWPFFDISKYLDENYEISEFQKLEEALEERYLDSYVIDTCQWSVKIVGMNDTKKYLDLHLPAPYEPLIRMYERGGSIRRENCFINIFYAGVPLKSIEEHIQSKPLLDLSDEALDQLDKEENQGRQTKMP